MGIDAHIRDKGLPSKPVLSDPGASIANTARRVRRVGGRIYRAMRELPGKTVELGMPPGLFGYRWVAGEPVRDYIARTGSGHVETIHEEAVARNPLPMNVADREWLPKDRGWWGYSFHDVPERVSAETFIATVPNCRIVSFVEPRKNNFYPCIVDDSGRALHLREIAFRPGHREPLRTDTEPVRRKKVTWVLERVYHNHSHWLTAHLPKFRLLQERGELENVLLPQKLNPVMETSLRRMGIDPDAFATYDPTRPLEVEELTVLGTDRFRPELLRPVRDAVGGRPVKAAWRRVFISRAKSKGRRLLDEDEIWPLLEDAGFERVFMEELTFDQQITLMQETALLLAPHGAGLTNMMFCQPGAHVVELADLGFPNPNFYAVASAMGLRYWLVEAQAVGDVHPLEVDLKVGRKPVADVLEQIEKAGTGTA